MRNVILVLGVMCAGAVTGYGQVINTTAGAHVPNNGRVNSINKREQSILWSIDGGAQSGALTPARVEEFKRRFNLIQAQKTNAMTEHKGSLSESEWSDLRNRAGRLEKDIAASWWKH